MVSFAVVLSLGGGNATTRFHQGIAGAAEAWPLGGGAQQSSGLRRIGVLMISPENDSESQFWVKTSREGLEKLGWKEGRNIRSDIRWSVAALPRLAADDPMSRSRKSNDSLRKITRTNSTDPVSGARPCPSL
jgi:hypothetical protein